MGSVPLTPAPTNQNQFPATSPTRTQSNLMRLLPLWLCHLHQLVSILDSTNPWSSLPVKWQRGGSRARTMTLVFYPYRSAATASGHLQRINRTRAEHPAEFYVSAKTQVRLITSVYQAQWQYVAFSS